MYLYLIFLGLNGLWLLYFLLSFMYFTEYTVSFIIFHTLCFPNLFISTIMLYNINKKLEEVDREIEREKTLNREIEELAETERTRNEQ